MYINIRKIEKALHKTTDGNIISMRKSVTNQE